MSKLEPNKTTSKELAFLICGYVIASALVVVAGTDTGHDTWIAVILGFAESLIFAALYIGLARRYPGKTLIEINDTVFGPYLGKLVSLCYLWYFFQIAALVLRNYGDFLIAIIYPETPMLVILIMLTLLCASAARNGIEVIARCGLVLVPLVFITLILTFLMLLPEMDFDNFLPLFEAPLKDILLSAHSISAFPFGEVVAFLMLLAYLDKPGQAKKTILTGLSGALVVILIATIRNTATLGITAEMAIYPSYEAVRMVNIAEIITRMEILIAANFILLGFLKISVLYYATALGLAQMLRLQTYLPLILPLGSLMISLSILQFERNIENVYFVTKIYPIYSLPFELFLPGLTLLISLLRGQSAKGASKR